MTEQLNFSLTGEFVTHTAREWLYAEKRPYEKVLDFLLACMCGTNYSAKTLKKLAHDVLVGKKKFIGTTRDNSFCMVDDDADIIKEYSYAFKNDEPIERYVGEATDVENRDSVMAGIRAYEKKIKKINAEMITKSTLLHDFGWLNPSGKFFGCNWGEHESQAMERLEEYYPDVPTGPFDEGYYAGDYLVKKGWLLLHNPSDPGGFAVIRDDDIQSATKRQKEFLWDYFLERGMEKRAMAIWKD